MIKKSEGNIWTGTECLTMRAMSRRLGAPVKDLPMPGGETETVRHGNSCDKNTIGDGGSTAL